MNNKRQTMKGSISLLAIIGVVATALGGSYYYIDRQADLRANDTMITLVDEAKSQGVDVRYSAVDASPLTQSIEITDFKIVGNEQEPDIEIGTITVTGFSWQDLHGDDEKNTLSPDMSIALQDGELRIKKSMFEHDTDLQAFVRVFGDTIPFATKAAYSLDSKTKELHVSFTHAIEENLFFESHITLGNMTWLANVDPQQTRVSDTLMLEAMKSTLNSMSITFKNWGLIEKVRAVAIKQTGKTNEQLTQESIAQMKQLQIATQQWGPVFVPLIDEVIKFTREPKQLTLMVHPKTPLTSDAFLMAFMGGEKALITLINDAQITLKAN